VSSEHSIAIEAKTETNWEHRY